MGKSLTFKQYHEITITDFPEMLTSEKFIQNLNMSPTQKQVAYLKYLCDEFLEEVRLYGIGTFPINEEGCRITSLFEIIEDTHLSFEDENDIYENYSKSEVSEMISILKNEPTFINYIYLYNYVNGYTDIY